jgi:hypothetical protein
MTTIKSGEANISQTGGGNRKGHPKNSTNHLNAAKKYYKEAEKLREEGDNEKAALSSFKSKMELRYASEALKEEMSYYEMYD